MGRFVLKDCYFEVDGVDLSDRVDEVAVNRMYAEEDGTTFGSGGGTEQLLGLRTDSFEATFLQDYATSMVDATLEPLFAAGDEFTVACRPHVAATSDTNPSYEASCLLPDYSPLAGKVGSRAEAKIKFNAQRGPGVAGGGIVRHTT